MNLMASTIKLDQTTVIGRISASVLDDAGLCNLIYLFGYILVC